MHSVRTTALIPGAASGTWPGRFGYQGQAWIECGSNDSSQRLHLSPTRLYDPSIGRFTSPDPIVTHRPELHYAYSRNTPTLYCDPTGRDEERIALLKSLMEGDVLRPEERGWASSYLSHVEDVATFEKWKAGASMTNPWGNYLLNEARKDAANAWLKLEQMGTVDKGHVSGKGILPTSPLSWQIGDEEWSRLKAWKAEDPEGFHEYLERATGRKCPQHEAEEISQDPDKLKKWVEDFLAKNPGVPFDFSGVPLDPRYANELNAYALDFRARTASMPAFRSALPPTPQPSGFEIMVDGLRRDWFGDGSEIPRQVGNSPYGAYDPNRPLPKILMPLSPGSGIADLWRETNDIVGEAYQGNWNPLKDKLLDYGAGKLKERVKNHIEQNFPREP